MKLLRWLFNSRAFISVRMYQGADDLPVLSRLTGLHVDLVIAMAAAMESNSELESVVMEAVKILQDERKNPPAGSTPR